MLAEDIVLQTGTPAFSRGPEGTITAWNASAEGLFAMPAAEVVGRRCCDVIAGRDVFGNDYCAASCPCWRMAQDDRPIHPYRLTSSDAFGGPVELRVSVLATRGRLGLELVHLLEPAVSRIVFATFPDELGNGDCPATSGSDALTRRELEVLRLLSVGWSTDDIAERLMISPTTVRNHISRCLQKLDAHSRLEAVSIARRLDLV